MSSPVDLDAVESDVVSALDGADRYGADVYSWTVREALRNATALIAEIRALRAEASDLHHDVDALRRLLSEAKRLGLEACDIGDAETDLNCVAIRAALEALTRCTITVLRSSRHGGHATVLLDGLRSGYTVTSRRDRGVTVSHTIVTGTLRLGPVGDWLSDMVPHLIATGCGVTAYDLEVRDGECVARSVATVEARREVAA